MTTSDSADPLTREAIDWIMRLEQAPGDAGLRAAAETWRKAGPDHALAWTKAEKAWRWLGDPMPDLVEPSRPLGSTPARRSPRLRRSTGRRWAAGIVGAVAAALVLLYVPSVLTSLRADFATTTAELRQVSLEDGTIVELAPQSALDVRFTADRRSVILLSGEAFFDVAANPDRPFEVRAGELSVLVTGTAFDVRLQTEALAVAVARGSVQAQSSFPASASPVRLGPGDRLVVDRRTGTARRTGVPADEVGSWREHRIFVERATVAEVVDALRRYHAGWIILADDDLGKQRVAGLYDLRDPDQALRILVEPFGGRVREVTPLLRIITGP